MCSILINIDSHNVTQTKCQMTPKSLGSTKLTKKWIMKISKMKLNKSNVRLVITLGLNQVRLKSFIIWLKSYFKIPNLTNRITKIIQSQIPHKVNFFVEWFILGNYKIPTVLCNLNGKGHYFNFWFRIIILKNSIVQLKYKCHCNANS